MALKQKATAELRAMYALHHARQNRHHKTCRCRRYAGLYCSAADALWSNALNRELDNIARTGVTDSASATSNPREPSWTTAQQCS